MRPDELSALAAIDLLEMMFKSGVLRLDNPARSIDEVFGDAGLAPPGFSQSGQGNVQQEWLAPTGSAEFQEGEREWR